MVYTPSNTFSQLDVVLLCRERGGFAYGYILEPDGKSHYLCRIHPKDTGTPLRMPNYGIGKLTNLTQTQVQVCSLCLPCCYARSRALSCSRVLVGDSAARRCLRLRLPPPGNQRVLGWGCFTRCVRRADLADVMPQSGY